MQISLEYFLLSRVDYFQLEFLETNPGYNPASNPETQQAANQQFSKEEQTSRSQRQQGPVAVGATAGGAAGTQGPLRALLFIA